MTGGAHPSGGTAYPLLAREVDPEERQRNEDDHERDHDHRDQARPAAPAKGRPADATPEDDQAGRRRDPDHEHGREQDGALEGEVRQPHGHDHERCHGDRCGS